MVYFMKTFKFGQLISREDLCDRKEEIVFLQKICATKGRAIVYGRRRFGKTSIVKNVIIGSLFSKNKKFLAIYADLFQLDSIEDMALRLKTALEQALSQRAKLRTFIESVQNYLKHFRIEISADPLSGMPYIHLAGQNVSDEKSLNDVFLAIRSLSKEYDILLALDEFQDIRNVSGLEGKLRSEIQSLDNIPVILLGSKRHILRDIFHDEANPFYGFGTDVEIKEIVREHWLPYMRERFEPCDLQINEEGMNEICCLMKDVPNAIQELCQWITLSGQKGVLTTELVHKNLLDLITNKSSRYIEKLASFSAKEKKVLLAVAQSEPVSSVTSTKFLKLTSVSATATRATMSRLEDQGVLDLASVGYTITDPIFKIFLTRQ